ncbi:hypothetical protein CMI42_05485 [Candidatus Pacearchaeota archaeon]|nr:hypothetical protein [Candidatus Pacearchaeota archaeon]|tara:strand:+ start:140 stop:337 length:198 start_codon:yes stop_codon:yes gene_type:complete
MALKNYICPKCKCKNWSVSSKISLFGNNHYSEGGRIGAVSENKECNECGYVGPFATSEHPSKKIM